MCSISVNKTTDQKITALGDKQKQRIEKNLFTMADAASTTNAGPFDEASCLLHDFPSDLKPIRRRRWGRHRIFFMGHHSQCSYWAFYLKTFKQSGKEDEHDKALHERLRTALSDQTVRLIEPAPDE